MGVNKSLTTATQGHTGRAVTGFLGKGILLQPGYGDLRARSGGTVVFTPQAFASTDEFKIRVYSNAFVGRGATWKQGTPYVDTIAFTNGTDAAASDLQTALRTATGDTALAVTGSTDTGPFTVTAGAEASLPYMEVVGCVACSVKVTRPAVAYHYATGKPSTATVTPAVKGTSGIAGVTQVPLGYSIRDDDGTIFAGPTVASAVGGSGQIIFADTEEAGGGSVFYSVKNVATHDPEAVQTVAASGDKTVTGLSAGNYVCYAFTQTTEGRVSRPSDPIYTTVT